MITYQKNTTALINIGQYRVCHKGVIMVAQNLGSCLGMAVIDRNLKLFGMIHCLLPLSSSDEEKAKKNPALYVDTGVPLLLEEMLREGSTKSDLEIYIAGCGNSGKDLDPFEIGHRNYTVFRKLAWKNALFTKGEHVGGDMPRSLILDTVEERVFIKLPDKTIYL
ncbi:MAG: chemotaxis protein CheD [Deltaproteobacteria bacterium]|nr:chemotaxis protein CheD [Deltaproteobacteria bacterium]MCX7952200.1 chemotaxis protein CheD [Deltaproteobacteria bacterium]